MNRRGSNVPPNFVVLISILKNNIIFFSKTVMKYYSFVYNSQNETLIYPYASLTFPRSLLVGNNSNPDTIFLYMTRKHNFIIK